MTTRPLYQHGRAASLDGGDTHPGRPDYDLVLHLRAIRADGDEAMTAAEEYDPNFCLHLSACKDATAADAVLEQWLSRRVAALQRTKHEFKRVWADAQEAPSSAADAASR